jgi:hypothetical protein
MKYRLIGLYEIFTGIFGTLMVLLHSGRVATDKSAVFGLVVGVFLYAGLAIAGYLLMNKGKEAVKLSLWAQVVQVFGITYNGTQYLFSAAAFLYLQILHGFRLQVEDKLVNFNFSAVSEYFPPEIRIYILPLFLIAWLVIKSDRKGVN